MLQSDIENIRSIIKKGRIDSKREFYLLYENNLLGNKALTWNSYDEIVESEWKDCVCVRYRKNSERSKVKYNIPIDRLEHLISDLEKEGIYKKDLLFNQSMPDEKLTIQGELMQTENGFYILYTKVKKPMNIALRESEKSVWGLKAKLILERYLDASSYADIKEILEIFPDSVIEFSSYEINVGTLPGRNTIIWEVRNF